jgi:hypothetical protein
VNADTSASPRYIEEASTVYTNVVDALTEHWPESDEEYFKAMQDIGLKQELKYSWTYRADTAGTTSVNGGPKTDVWVKYEPTGTPPLSAEVMGSLRSSAKSIEFYPPNLLDFTTTDKRPSMVVENTVEVRLPSAWLCTMSRLSRPRAAAR